MKKLSQYFIRGLLVFVPLVVTVYVVYAVFIKIDSLFPFKIRVPHVLHSRRASHSGHRFQLAFTTMPQLGHESEPSGFSHAGQSVQVSLTGSPHAGQRGCASESFITFLKAEGV